MSLRPKSPKRGRLAFNILVMIFLASVIAAAGQLKGYWDLPWW